MDQVRIARFIDLQEAQIATGLLQSRGLTVYLQNEQLGALDFLIRQAIGGFGLWVRQDEVALANAVLSEATAGPIELEPDDEMEPDPYAPVGPAQGWVAITLVFLAWLFGAALFWTVAISVRLRRLPGSVSLSGIALASAAVLGGTLAAMLLLNFLLKQHLAY
jgi:hypothetical protein